jgi:hypothetical protein
MRPTIAGHAEERRKCIDSKATVPANLLGYESGIIRGLAIHHAHAVRCGRLPRDRILALGLCHIGPQAQPKRHPCTGRDSPHSDTTRIEPPRPSIAPDKLQRSTAVMKGAEIDSLLSESIVDGHDRDATTVQHTEQVELCTIGLVAGVESTTVNPQKRGARWLGGSVQIEHIHLVRSVRDILERRFQAKPQTGILELGQISYTQPTVDKAGHDLSEPSIAITETSPRLAHRP